MTNIWDQTINISEELVRKLITKQINIEITSLKLIGEGFDNFAYLVNKKLVFRFPRREFGVTCMESEIALLPYIATKISFPLSAPKFIGLESADFPYPFAGYPIIPGKPLSEVMDPLINDPQFARIIGSWLKQLHAIPVLAEHHNIISHEHNIWRLNIPNRIEVLTKSINQYEEYYANCGFAKDMLLDLINSFSHLNFAEYQACYLHGDLYCRHIIVGSNLLPSGLIDFGDIHIGHPGIDLSIAAIFTDSALLEFISSYGECSAEMMKVAMFRALCHSAMCLPYACKQNDPGFKKWTIAVFMREIISFQQLLDL